MTFNQKILALMTLIALGTTSAITFVMFEPPYVGNFWLGFGTLLFAEFLFGAFWIQQIAKADALLPVALSVWALNLAYLAFALGATCLTHLQTKHYLLLHVVAFAAFTMLHLLFRLTEHHAETMAKDDEPEKKIEKAKVSWR